MSDRYRGRDDEEDTEFDLEEAEPPKRRGRLLAAMIALFAIGGFGGVLWYAYSQGQRSADAVAPILKADGEPTRQKPDQPGGMVVPHQDKLVLNSMQQSSRPAPQAERLLPPAEAPLPQTTRAASPTASVPLAPPQPAPMPAPAPQAAMPPPMPPAAMPAPAPTTSGSLVAPPAPPPVPPASSASAPPVPPPSVPTLPAPAPQTAARPPVQPPATPPPPAAAPRVSTGGEWRIQLGSFPAAEQATSQWDRLKRAHAELQPLGLTTVRIDIPGKGVWYRLQAGPLSEPSARALCEDLKSKKRDCLVVRP